MSARRERQRGRRMRWVAVFASALCLVGLSGCAMLPTSGAVHRVTVSADTDTDARYVINASGPASGASQTEIVQGFLAAGADSANGYETAREFLTSAAAAAWQPESQVTVVESTPSQSTGASASQITASAHEIGLVDAAGEYQQSDGQFSESFHLVRVEGEWRIDSVPAGTVITRGNFQLVFAGRRLPFLDETGQRFVADVRWFPVGASTATRVVSALLQGPSAQLRGSVLTAIPEGTRLAVDAVATSGKTTTVTLSSEALSDDARQVNRMFAQIQAALAEVPGTGTLRLLSGTTELRPASDTESPSWPQVGSSGLLVRSGDGAISAYEGGIRGKSLRSALNRIGQGEGFSVWGDVAATALSDGTLRRVRGTTVLSSASAQAGGSVWLDADGWAWQLASGKVTAWPSQGSSVSLQGEGMSAFALAPDGVRAAWLVPNADGSHTDVVFGVVQRSSQGAPQSLSSGVTVATVDGTPGSLTWVGANVAVATRSGNTSPVSVVGVNGVVSTLTPLEPVRELAGGDTSDSLRVLTDTGILYSPRGTGWVRLRTGIRNIAYSWN